MRKKWEEVVEYVCQEPHSETKQKHKIVMFNGIEVGEEVKEALDQLECDGVGYDYRTIIKELIRFYKEHHPDLES